MCDAQKKKAKRNIETKIYKKNVPYGTPECLLLPCVLQPYEEKVLLGISDRNCEA